MKKKIIAVTAFIAVALLLFTSAGSAFQTEKSTLLVKVPHNEYGISSTDKPDPSSEENPQPIVINPHYKCVFLPPNESESLSSTEELSQIVTDTNNEYASFQEEDKSAPVQDKSFKIIHHEAEYKTIHHDAVTIHHDAEYNIIHNDAEGHFEETVVTPAWDETVKLEKTVQHVFCNESDCHMDFTAAGMSSSQIWDHLEAHAFKGEASGHHTEDIRTVVTETIHHDAITERVWIVDKDAWDEKVLVKEAWDEVKPEFDERVLVKEAWDEKIPEQ